MANDVKQNPITIDTWSADITISTSPVTVKKILFKSAADGDILVLENKNGDQVAWLVQTGAADTVELDFGDGFKFVDGLQIDVSDCTGIGSGDLAWIYLK